MPTSPRPDGRDRQPGNLQPPPASPPPGNPLPHGVTASPIAVITVIADLISIASQILQGVKAGQDALAIAGSVVFHSKALQDLVGRVAPTVAQFAGDHLGTHKETLAGFGDVLSNVVGDEVLAGTDAIAEASHLHPLKSLAAHFKQREASFTEDVHAIAGTHAGFAKFVEAVDSELIGKGLGLFKEAIEDHADLLPEGVNQIAGAAIMRGLEATLSAHVLALGIEAVYPLHGLNVVQAVTSLIELLGIGKIGGHVVGPTLAQGIGIPAEHQARKRFRTTLPDAEYIRSRFAKRQMTRDDYVRILELAGFQDDVVQFKADHPYHHPPATRLFTLLQDTDVSADWIASELRFNEWPDDLVTRATEGIMHKMRKSGRDKYLTALHAAFVDGMLAQDTYEKELKALILDDTHRAYYLGAASWERGKKVVSELATAITNQVRNGIISDAAASEMLSGIGLTDKEVSIRITLAELQRNAKHLRDEDVQFEKELRTLQAAGVKSLKAAVASGTIDNASFEAHLEALGYTPNYAKAVAALAELDAQAKVPAPLYLHGLTSAGAQPPPAELVPPPKTAVPLEQDLTALRIQLATAAAADKPALRALIAQQSADVQAAKATDTAAQKLYDTTAKATLTNLEAQLRRGLLSRDSFLSLGASMGFDLLQLEQRADASLLAAHRHLEGVSAADQKTALTAAQQGIKDLMADLVSAGDVAHATALTLLHNAGVPVSPSDLTDALITLATSKLDNQIKTPFGTLDDKNLLWVQVLETVVQRLEKGFGGDTAVGKALAALGLKRPDDKTIGAIAGAVDALIGAFTKRKRDPTTIPRTDDPSMPPLPLPIDDPNQVSAVKAQIANWLQQLSTCREAYVAAGGSADSYPSPDLTVLDGGTLDQLVALRNSIHDAIINCGTGVAGQNQNTGGNPPPAGGGNSGNQGPGGEQIYQSRALPQPPAPPMPPRPPPRPPV